MFNVGDEVILKDNFWEGYDEINHLGITDSMKEFIGCVGVISERWISGNPKWYKVNGWQNWTYDEIWMIPNQPIEIDENEIISLF